MKIRLLNYIKNNKKKTITFVLLFLILVSALGITINKTLSNTEIINEVYYSMDSIYVDKTAILTLDNTVIVNYDNRNRYYDYDVRNSIVVVDSSFQSINKAGCIVESYNGKYVNSCIKNGLLYNAYYYFYNSENKVSLIAFNDNYEIKGSLIDNEDDFKAALNTITGSSQANYEKALEGIEKELEKYDFSSNKVVDVDLFINSISTGNENREVELYELIKAKYPNTRINVFYVTPDNYSYEMDRLEKISDYVFYIDEGTSELNFYEDEPNYDAIKNNLFIRKITESYSIGSAISAATSAANIPYEFTIKDYFNEEYFDISKSKIISGNDEAIELTSENGKPVLNWNFSKTKNYGMPNSELVIELKLKEGVSYDNLVIPVSEKVEYNYKIKKDSKEKNGVVLDTPVVGTSNYFSVFFTDTANILCNKNQSFGTKKNMGEVIDLSDIKCDGYDIVGWEQYPDDYEGIYLPKYSKVYVNDNKFVMPGHPVSLSPIIEKSYLSQKIIANDNANAFLQDGKTINKKIHKVSLQDNLSSLENIKSIKKANSLPSNMKFTNNNIISLNNSESSVYIWFNKDEETLYYYTSATKIYLNGNASYMFSDMINLEEISDLKYFDTSLVTNMSYMFYNCNNLLSTNTFLNWDTSEVVNMSYMFGNCRKLENLDGLINWDTSELTEMEYIFDGCETITNLNGLANWNTSKLMELMSFFSRCKNLVDISGLTNWDVSNVNEINLLFRDCTKLTNVDALANWNISNVTFINNVFYNCQSLSDINGLANWDFSKVNVHSGFFYGCKNLTNLEPISGWDLSNVESLSDTFAECTSLTDISPIANWKFDKLSSMTMIFYNCTSLADISPITNWDVSKVERFFGVFSGCKSLTDISPISGWVTSNIVRLSGIFSGCANLTDISPIANWDVSNVTDMRSLFSGCTKLTDLSPIANWNTSKVIDISYLFQGCTSLTDISPISNWNVYNVEDMTHTFSSCTKITDISPLANWNITKVNYMWFTFYNTRFTNVNALSNWDVSNVTSFDATFRNCTNLQDISGLSNWNTSNGTSFDDMFNNTKISNLTPISNWDLSSAVDTETMFKNCKSITSLDALSNWNVSNVKRISGMFENTTNLADASGINNWDIREAMNFKDMFKNSPVHPEFTMLIGTWDNGTFIPSEGGTN